MTSFQDLINALSPYRLPLLLAMVAIPLVSYGVGQMLKGVSEKSCGWFLSVMIHLTVIPGICMSLAVCYLMFITRANMLADVDIVLYFGPVLCMAATLVAISKVMRFSDIPGFDRIGGLIMVTGLSFGMVFFLSRLHFMVAAFTSIWTFVIGFIVFFALIRVGADRIAGKRRSSSYSGEDSSPPSS